MNENGNYEYIPTFRDNLSVLSSKVKKCSWTYF